MPQSKPSPTLLIVDDEPAIRLLLAEYFKKKFQVIALKDGIECVPYLQSNPLPTVTVLDFEMPGMSGFDVIKRVRANREWDQLIIIVLSARESSKDRIACLHAGADDYVVKPFNPEEVEARIEAILRRVRQASH